MSEREKPVDFTAEIFERLWPDYLAQYQQEMDDLAESLEDLTDDEWREFIDRCDKTKEG